MGYPIYKLLRAVNRQYPNNGFINYVDVREDTYDNTEDQMIDEDLRDLINETIQEVYKDVAIDEVYSFPTVPGQNQYVLPEDCDLRDIQEVTRTYQGVRGPLPTPFGPDPGPEPGPDPQYDYTVTFTINPLNGTLSATQGTALGDNTVIYSVTSGDTVPETPIVIPNSGYTFYGWTLNGTDIVPIDDILNTPVEGDLTYTGIFGNEEDEEMRYLTGDLTLTDGVAPTLEGGFYYTGPHSIFVSGATLPIFGSYSVFYYDAASQTLTGPFASATYTNGMWEIYRDAMLATSVANNDRIPINSAVNAAIGGATSIATASLTADFSSTADETVETIPLDDFDVIGGFEYNPLGGYISIPSGSSITKVKISANIQCEVDTTSSGITRFFYVIKEAAGGTKTTLKDTFISTTASGTIYEILSFAPFVIDVEPGDKIYLATMTPSQVSRKIVGDADTYLTIEEVKDTVTSSDYNPLGGNGGGSNDNPLAG